MYSRVDLFIFLHSGYGDNVEVSKDGKITDYQNIAEIKVYGKKTDIDVYF